MINDTLIRTIKMNCPLCDETHEVEERQRIAQAEIKNEIVEYEEIYYLCLNSEEDEQEFATAKILDENLLRARNTYKTKKGLLISSEIVAIRDLYGITQSELSNLLGWGEATVSRYESKAIQDETYDDILRLIAQNPMETLRFLSKHKDKFSEAKYQSIRSKVIEKLDEFGRAYLNKQELESEYINYHEESDFNGNTTLNIEKLENVVAFFAKSVNGLYKVKLMKLLWYTDVLCFKQTGIAMTGLVYKHMPMGALPIAHYKILELETINVQEEFDINFNSSYKILPNNKLDLSCLNQIELDVLSRVAAKFRNYTGAEVTEYMHLEKAYLETNVNQIIPFSLASTIKDF